MVTLGAIALPAVVTSLYIPTPAAAHIAAPSALVSVINTASSGRLKTLIYELAEKNDWLWQVELTISPDRLLKKTTDIVVSSDSAVLDKCQSWTNLTDEIVTDKLPTATVIDLSSVWV